MHNIVSYKLAENFLRGAFIILATFSMSIVDSGSFGVMLASISLFTYICSFEKRISFQREVSGKSFLFGLARVIQIYKFFILNFIFLSFIFIPIGLFVLNLSFNFILLTLIITLAEIIFNQAYQTALVIERLNFFQIINVFRNLFTFLVLLYFQFTNSELIPLFYVMLAWAVPSIFALMIGAASFFFLVKQNHLKHFRFNLANEYWDSKSHFIFGLIAMLILVVDRFFLSEILSPEELGIYVRNIITFSLMLQFFTIASINRVTPKIFLHVKSKDFASVKSIFYRESLVNTGLIGVYLTSIIAAYQITPLFFTDLGIVLEFQMIISTALFLRLFCDFYSIQLIAHQQEKQLIKITSAQLVVVSLSIIICTKYFGIDGAFISIIISNLAYIILFKLTSRKYL